MIRYLYPTKIKEVENVINADGLFHKKDLQIGLNEPDIVKFQPNSAIVLDFGKEIRGGVRILTYETQDIKCVRIRIRFGESLSECFAELGEKNATNTRRAISKRICLLGRICVSATPDSALCGSIRCPTGGFA